MLMAVTDLYGIVVVTVRSATGGSMECNIPPVEVRAGTAFPRDFPRAEPEGNHERRKLEESQK